MFWSNARGKVGDVVFSNVKGQVITRKYQPCPTNPRTDAQQLQRAKFSNAVKFFKHAQQAYFRFAYEDKKKTESEYNAFMRYNASKAMLPTRNQYLGYYPSIGMLYQIAAGSLPSIDDVSAGTADITFKMGTTTWSTQGTIGELTAALAAKYGLQSGDIITMLRINCAGVSDIKSDPAAYPTWNIWQFRLDETSTQTVDSVIKDPVWEFSTPAVGEANFTVGATDGHVMASMIVSRVLTSGTKVADSMLYVDETLEEIYTNSNTESWRKAALETWSSSGSAVLQGSLSE